MNKDEELMIRVEPHPLLDLCVFVTEFPSPLGELVSLPELVEGLAAQGEQGAGRSEEVRGRVRDLLRHGGFKPTGRSKPSSEYLFKAAATGGLASINAAVDVCNAVSLECGLPISVVDMDLVRAPLRVAVAGPGESYVFNASGQTIDVGGLLCLFDASGPCANAVKDSQRTKTHPETRRTLSLVWGTGELPGRTAETEARYRAWLLRHGAAVTPVSIVR